MRPGQEGAACSASNAPVEISTQDNCKKKRKRKKTENRKGPRTPTQASFCPRSAPAGLGWPGGSWRGGLEAPGPTPELTVTAPADPFPLARGRPPRAPGRALPCVAWAPRLAGVAGTHAHLQIRLCSRERSPPIPLTLPPRCGPARRPYFLPGGGRAGMPWPGSPRPPAIRAAQRLPGRAGGRQQAPPAARECPAEGPAPRAHRRQPAPPPGPRPRVPVAGPAGSSARGRRRAAPGPDRSLARAARHVPAGTLASVVPSERAGTAPWTAEPGGRPSDVIGNAFLSSRCRIPAVCTCGGCADTFFLFNPRCVPARPSVGRRVCICSLKAVTAK